MRQRLPTFTYLLGWHVLVFSSPSKLSFQPSAHVKGMQNAVMDSMRFGVVRDVPRRGQASFARQPVFGSWAHFGDTA
ncbi:hypothetical protein DENSPDRAFT_834325 [Dentipellis sp. KUC8613]|nr:hypothetical protein DENSPDRAFT_834325 [Dentipellis sp. KUC8613]